MVDPLLSVPPCLCVRQPGLMVGQLDGLMVDPLLSVPPCLCVSPFSPLGTEKPEHLLDHPHAHLVTSFVGSLDRCIVES